jgi:hypothetical protein
MSLGTKIVLLVIGFLTLQGCAAQRTGTTNDSDKPYNENLSTYRPKFSNDSAKTDSSGKPAVTKTYVEKPLLNVNTKVDAVLDSVDRLNQSRKFVDGYTIQIYSGTNREDAMNAKKRMNEMDEISPTLQYNQPKFRVTAGAYYNKLEAQQDLMRIRRLFPNSILVPEKVQIK